MVWFAQPQPFPVEELAGMVSKATGVDPHVALAPEPVFLDDEERAAANRALDERYRTYSGRSNSVEEPEFAEIAELLCRPRDARYGWISDLRNRTQRAVLVSDSPWFGVLAVRDGERVFLRTFRDENPSRLLATTLPEAPWRAADHPITVARRDLVDSDEHSIGGRGPSRTVRRARQIGALEPSLIAELYAAPGTGGWSRPLRIYDNAEGRWSLLIDASDNARLAPSGDAEIAALLDQL